MHTALAVFIVGVLISLLLIIPLAGRKRHIGMYIHSADFLKMHYFDYFLYCREP